MVLKHGDKNFMRNIPSRKQKLKIELSTQSSSSDGNKVDLKESVDDVARDSLILYGALQIAWQDYESKLKDTLCLYLLSNIASQE
jgi:hypothetical protein